MISDNQLWVDIVPVGHPFNSSCKTLDSAEYNLGLGNSIGKFWERVIVCTGQSGMG